MGRLSAMKKCYKCGKRKKLSAFSVNPTKKDGRCSQCKECHSDYYRKYYQAHSDEQKKRVALLKIEQMRKVRKWILAYFAGHPCVDCGETDPVVLDFDHVRGKKEENVGTMTRGYALRNIQSEVAKCEVRCANCHRRITAKRNGFWRDSAGAVAQVGRAPDF